MGLHIAQVGVGRVGRPTANAILSSGIASKLTVCDAQPGLANAFAEELGHAAAGHGIDAEIDWCSDCAKICGADIVLVTAGMPRLPGQAISRRDLAAKNAKIMRQVAESVVPHNPDAIYVIVTNPADAMATVFRHFSKSNKVIGTGTALETLRFRAKLAKDMGVPVSKVSGWVGGEHGEAAVVLWSTVKVNGIPVEKYAASKGITLSKPDIESYIKEVSKLIINNIGGTEFGPASAFRNVLQAIANDTGEVMPVSIPMAWPGVPEKVFVSVPMHLGRVPGRTLIEELTDHEKAELAKAAAAVYDTYIVARDAVADGA